MNRKARAKDLVNALRQYASTVPELEEKPKPKKPSLTQRVSDLERDIDRITAILEDLLIKPKKSR